MKLALITLALFSASAIAQAPAPRIQTQVPCAALTVDATAMGRKGCKKDLTVEDYCKAMTRDTTAQSRKICEKREKADAASAPKK